MYLNYSTDLRLLLRHTVPADPDGVRRCVDIVQFSQETGAAVHHHVPDIMCPVYTLHIPDIIGVGLYWIQFRNGP